VTLANSALHLKIEIILRMTDRAEIHNSLIQLQLSQLRLVELKSEIDKQFEQVIGQTHELVLKMSEHLINCVVYQVNTDGKVEDSQNLQNQSE
jgi:hypothetical protein